MRVSRKAIVAVLLVSFLGTLALGTLSLLYLSADPLLTVDGTGNRIADEPGVGNDAKTHAQDVAGPAGMPVWMVVVAALASALVMVTSFVLFRVEVRKEKAAIRSRKNRESYFRDLRKYNHQLKGPPRDNT